MRDFLNGYVLICQETYKLCDAHGNRWGLKEAIAGHRQVFFTLKAAARAARTQHLAATKGEKRRIGIDDAQMSLALTPAATAPGSARRRR